MDVCMDVCVFVVDEQKRQAHCKEVCVCVCMDVCVCVWWMNRRGRPTARRCVCVCMDVCMDVCVFVVDEQKRQAHCTKV